MARCKDCAWFPWKPGADLSGLPAMRCHPELPMRRWGSAGVEVDTTCERYKAAKPVEPRPQPEPKPAHEPPVEAPAPAKPKPRTKRKG